MSLISLNHFLSICSAIIMQILFITWEMSSVLFILLLLLLFSLFFFLLRVVCPVIDGPLSFYGVVTVQTEENCEKMAYSKNSTWSVELKGDQQTPGQTVSSTFIKRLLHIRLHKYCTMIRPILFNRQNSSSLNHTSIRKLRCSQELMMAHSLWVQTEMIPVL